MNALRAGLDALRRHWTRAGLQAPAAAEADVLRGLGLARSERVSYEVCASGRVKAVHQSATPDASRLRAAPSWRR